MKKLIPFAHFFPVSQKKEEIDLADFMIRFLICCLLLGAAVGILCMVQKFLGKYLTGRMRYHLWFCLFPLLVIPFFSNFPVPGFFIPSFLHSGFPLGETAHIPIQTAAQTAASAEWMNNFSMSVSTQTPSILGQAAFFIWLAGMAVTAFSMLLARIRLARIEHSALPVQNREILRLYGDCRKEMSIRKPIPVYSTAFLSSPVIAGLFHPRIYLPISLITDFSPDEIRFMLLHELFHYKHGDTIWNALVIPGKIVYWFHPLVRYAFQEMHNDREIACDTDVLTIIGENNRTDYGYTLLNLAEDICRKASPFAAGIGGNVKQIKQRIIHIASYHSFSRREKMRSLSLFFVTVLLLSTFLPLLSLEAADKNRYHFDETGKTISHPNLKKDFGEYQGSFVLYDTALDSWKIYNQHEASARISPASTFKIYIALSALEQGIITPEQTTLSWDGSMQPMKSWEQDHSLSSAMENSVNWYFEKLDSRCGLSSTQNFVRDIGYGNRYTGRDISSYWRNGSLRISPIEQVEMLEKLHENSFGFSPENVEAVKNSIRLFSTEKGTLYGKTGTLLSGGKYSGWFVGFLEKENGTCFFATNIQKGKNASGAAAAELTFSVLSRWKIWEKP